MDEARWEVPAGHLEDGDSALEAAIREWSEETGASFPKDAEQVGTWVSEDGSFQGFVFRIPHEEEIKLGTPDGEEISGIAWWDLDDLDEPEIRSKLRDSLDRVEPILERAEKGNPRPGPGGHREETLVKHHVKKVRKALASQVSPKAVATSFAALAGPAALAAGAAGGGVALAASFGATLSISVGALQVAILAMWADSWLAGAKSGRDSLDEHGIRVPSEDPLDQAIDKVDWGKWTPGKAPPAWDLPGFEDVSQELGKLITGISETTREEIVKTVQVFVDGRVAHVPWGPSDVAELAEEIEACVNGANRAMLIARTEVNRSMSQGAQDLFRRAGIAWFDLVTHPDACPICVAIREANPHPVGDQGDTPPIHPNCLPGSVRVVVPGDIPVGLSARDAVVSSREVGGGTTTAVALSGRHLGGVRAATERDFVGDLIEITLANGYNLSATSNHPIATARGWVPIAALTVGADVICSSGAEWEVDAVDPHEDHVPPTIEEIAQSLPVAFGCVPVAPEDFHGDGANSQVYVVRTHGLLRNHLQAPDSEHGGKSGLNGGDIRHRALHPHSTTSEAFFGEVASPDCSVGGGDTGLSLLGSRSGAHGVHGGAAPSDLDSFLEQDPTDGRAADSEGFCERLLAFASGITTDKVVRVRRYPFAGHVYNLETDGGWYIGNGIVTHNCRCSTAPATPG